MNVIVTLQQWIHHLNAPVLLVIGLLTLIGLYSGKTMKFVRLPSIIGFMLVGVLLGPSLFNVLDEKLQQNLSFISDVALGFVAFSIGLELSFKSLKKLSSGIVPIIFAESFAAFLLVTAGVMLLTGDLPLSLIFGAVAPASAPAGTVAVIKEYKAKGSLTQALYAVVGFDDGLGVIIFGFAAAVSRSIVSQSFGSGDSTYMLIAQPLQEIGLSFLLGGLLGIVFSILARKLVDRRDIFPLSFALVVITIGISSILHLSLILTNLIVGMVVVNTQSRSLSRKIQDQLTAVMPLLFILFFVLAGSNLHLGALPSLGVIGLVYVLCRSAGLTGGAWLGATVGRSGPKIRKYLGMGILSQAGVAIGLALIVKHDFSDLGAWGARIGTMVITTVTATSVIFEIVGPILTKIGLKKAGEIQ